jgi:hemerythrin-like metal-binding protein
MTKNLENIPVLSALHCEDHSGSKEIIVQQAGYIKALTECGASAAALRAEHYAIEDALNAISEAIIAGASPDRLATLVKIAMEFQLSHFREEEQLLRDADYPEITKHARAHGRLLERLEKVSRDMDCGGMEAAFSALDLLDGFHEHVAVFDTPAHEYLLQTSRGVLQRLGRIDSELDRIARESF